MINEIAGNLWWQRIGRDSDDVYMYLQAGHAVYRCSQHENAWRQVEAPADPPGYIFSAPLDKRIAKCLTDADGCKYIVFSDHTAIRVFDPPGRPGGGIRIHGGGASFLNRDECDRLLVGNPGMSETAIICPAGIPV
jgi:hypothetical protein